MLNKYITLSNLTLLVALALSTVAEFYSIMGLVAIFAGAMIPVIVMGVTLGIAKITTTVWLRKYWNRASWVLKLYLVPAVIALALLTSMGIFGFLSKAHMDQGIISGDAQSKVAMYDEKIKTSKDNIDANRKALKQLDEAVDQVMGRSTSEQGADKAVQVRKSQANDRKRILAEIQAEQKTINQLSEERAPLASELRKIEAEVGPIKYIAALIYGDNADANMLEAAVRWMIILLVIVFDPLAIALVLAANASKTWDKEDALKDETVKQSDNNEELSVPPIIIESVESEKAIDPTPNVTNQVIEPVVETVVEPIIEPVVEPIIEPVVEPIIEPVVETVVEPIIEPIQTVIAEPELDKQVKEVKEQVKEVKEEVLEEKPVEIIVAPEIEIETAGITVEPFKVDGNYIAFDGKHMHKDVFQNLNPELFKLKPDGGTQTRTDFGTKFPEVAFSGDIFVRVDLLPNRVFKFNGNRWIELSRDKTESYLFNEKYIQHLVDKLSTGEYDPELLTEAEKESIAEYLKNQPADKNTSV